MTKLEQHTKAFLKVRDILQNMGEMFALAGAYKSLISGTVNTQHKKQLIF